MPVHSGSSYLHDRGLYSLHKKTFVKYVNASASAVTHNLLRFRKHYWGPGIFRVVTQRAYYDSYSYGEYVCYGHTRSGHSPYTNIATIRSGYGPSWSSITYVSGYQEGYADLTFTCPAYYGFTITIEVHGSIAHNDVSNNLYPGSTSQYYIY